MKTIERAASIYAEPIASDLSHKNMDDLNICDLEDYIVESFKEGVEFAQRWIPVEEELPEVGEIVLVRTKINKVTTCEMYIPKDYLDNILGEKEWSASYNFKQAITHWRPINLK